MKHAHINCRCQQVVGSSDGVDVSGEVQVEVLCSSIQEHSYHAASLLEDCWEAGPTRNRLEQGKYCSTATEERRPKWGNKAIAGVAKRLKNCWAARPPQLAGATALIDAVHLNQSTND
eukprot:scaffold26455_cov18-Tisochrysis_lutea.AAC.2